MLHTQIMQCAPDATWFYCDQAPAGYGGYRADFNSSHAYFENLFFYCPPGRGSHAALPSLALSERQPLNKIQGLHLARLHTAVARLALTNPPEPLDFYTVPPCRAVDTRTGPLLVSREPRTLPIAGVCGIPSTASAVAVNLASIAPMGAGNLMAWPAGHTAPTASSLNFAAGQTRTNNALLLLGGGSEMAVRPFIGGRRGRCIWWWL